MEFNPSSLRHQPLLKLRKSCVLPNRSTQGSRRHFSNIFVVLSFLQLILIGGENLKEVRPTIEGFKASGIGSILDLAMEADLDDVALSGKAAQDQAAKIANMMKESVDIASAQPGNFIAAKVTAFVPPAVLQRWTNSRNLLKHVYSTEIQDDQGRADFSQFSRLSKHFPRLQGAALREAFAAADHDKDGKVDWIDVSTTFSIFHHQLSSTLLRDNPTPVTENTALVTAEDLETASLVLAELEGLCDYARLKRVRIMMDAEQTYFQPAIDDVALGLCQRYNEPLTKGKQSNEQRLKYALIYNTYQLYLKDAYGRLILDVERAKRLNYAFGVKIVRGAYMVSERERAQELSLPDPINTTIQDTHLSFNNAIDFLVKSVAESQSVTEHVQPLRFVVASHNKASIAHACELMSQYKVDALDGTVAFAQLMGMQDATTYGLAAQGIKAYKVCFFVIS